MSSKSDSSCSLVEIFQNYLKSIKLCKNMCLLAWAVFLTCVGMLAMQGKFSNFLLNADLSSLFSSDDSDLASSNDSESDDSNNSESDDSNNSESDDSNDSESDDSNDSESDESEQPLLSAPQELEKYLLKHYAKEDDPSLVPPVAIVLDRLQINLSWRDPKKIEQDNGNLPEPTVNDYEQYFAAVVARLEAIAIYSQNSRGLSMNNELVPAVFRGKTFKGGNVKLPLEVELWVQRRQNDAEKRSEQLNLLDTFVLLIILGGFGSWIYLVRLHVEPQKAAELELSAYFYRPILGMALALAVFIVDVSLHSAVSTADVGQIRRETLILFAFGAGLLSEKAYIYVEELAGKGFNDKNSKNKNKDIES